MCLKYIEDRSHAHASTSASITRAVNTKDMMNTHHAHLSRKSEGNARDNATVSVFIYLTALLMSNVLTAFVFCCICLLSL